MKRLASSLTAQLVTFVLVAAVSLALHGTVRLEMVFTGVLCAGVCEWWIGRMRMRFLARVDSLNRDLEQRVSERTAALARAHEALLRETAEREALQAQLLEAERRSVTGAMAAAVRHELNNPLSATIGNLELALELLPEDAPELAEALSGALAGARQAADVAKDLLDLRRAPESTAPVDLPDVVASALRLAGPHLQRADRVVSELAPDTPPVMAAPSRLIQVLLNLLINASRSRRPDNPLVVTVRTAEEHGTVRIEVEDTGTGIPPELAGRLFEPFVTGRASEGGTGLGLYVCRTLVEGYGGTIEVQSTPDLGARFTIRLPAA